MYSRSGRVSGFTFFETHCARSLALAFLLFLTAFVFGVVLLATGYQSAFAADPDEAGVTPFHVGGEGDARPDLGPSVISPMDPTIGGKVDSFGSVLPLPQPDRMAQARGVYVLAECLAVAEYSDGDSTYLGYMPDLLPNEGGLTSTDFTYGDTSHTIEGLYYQETDAGMRRLVLELSDPLHDELALYAGNMAFPFSASTTSGLGPNARVWKLDSSLGWTPGQSLLVVIAESMGMPFNQAPQGKISHQQGPSFCSYFTGPAGSQLQADATVWFADMVVGEASDSTRTYLGYMPSMSPPEGELDDIAFAYDGVEYTIDALFYQEIGTVRQLVLSADRPLPDDLVLEFGGSKYPVADSMKLGADGNIHVWRLDSSLGWTEGLQLEVGLTQVEE